MVAYDLMNGWLFQKQSEWVRWHSIVRSNYQHLCLYGNTLNKFIWNSKNSIHRRFQINTYQHGTLHRNHRIAMRTAHHNSCRSRSSRPWSQIVCPPKTHGICCTGNRPHASASPCTINPVENRKNKTKIRMISFDRKLYFRIMRIPSNRFQWSCYIRRMYLRIHFRSI